MAEYIEQLGISPTKVVVFDNDRSSFDDIAINLAAAETELVLYMGLANHLIQLINSMKKDRHRFYDFFLIGGITGSSLFSSLKETARGFDVRYIQTTASKVFDTPEFKKGYKRL